MEIADILKAIRKSWLLMIAVTLVGVLVAAVVTTTTTKRYTASTAILFVVNGTGTVAELAQGSTYAEKQVASYAQVARTPLVLEPVIAQLGLQYTPQELSRSITTTVPNGTSIVVISVTDTDPTRSAEIANAVGAQLISAVSTLTPGQDQIRATTTTPAIVPMAPSSPNVFRNLALGLLLGLAAGVAAAIARDLLDNKIRVAADVRRVTDRSVIGSIPLEADSTPIASETDPHSLRAESYRRLRTNIQFLDIDDSKNSIVITSSIPGEGKSTTSLNLASVIAEAGKSVLLIDADMRRPRIHKYLEMEGSVGLTTVLVGRASLSEVVQPYGIGNLDILAAGRIPPNPSELLGSRGMRMLLDEACEKYDIVLLDSPPLLPVTDSAILARLTRGALLVIGAGQTNRNAVKVSLDSLEAVGAKTLGIVLNRTKVSSGDAYSYAYQYKETEPTRARATAPRPVGRRGVSPDSALVPAATEQPTLNGTQASRGY